MGFKKGQAAMEYLMTYGWAVLVIVIVIAALFSLTQFFKVGDQCLFSQKFFSCSDPNPQVLTNGKLVFTLKNLAQKGVVVHSASCITEDSQENAQYTSLGGELIPAGSIHTFASEALRCTRAGQAVSLREGEEFRGTLIVKYNYQNEPEGYEKRQAQAVLTATVVSPAGEEGGEQPS